MVIKSAKGFTLIEAMIAVAIIGILAAIAYPSYTEYVVQSNRTEGQRELLRVANLMEQYYLDNRAYTEDLTKLGLSSADNWATESGLYKLSSSVTGDTFELTATAQGNQATNDAACKELKVTDAGTRTPSTGCWE
ncbi:type IV pilin protein [Thalassotalea euphylliae]|uniref:type IV pilin protein n=1 Tax=Thalassotalea euphylliae TaxID=1655234 RepID=UPI003627AC4E